MDWKHLLKTCRVSNNLWVGPEPHPISAVLLLCTMAWSVSPFKLPAMEKRKWSRGDVSTKLQTHLNRSRNDLVPENLSKPVLPFPSPRNLFIGWWFSEKEGCISPCWLLWNTEQVSSAWHMDQHMRTLAGLGCIWETDPCVSSLGIVHCTY